MGNSVRRSVAVFLPLLVLLLGLTIYISYSAYTEWIIVTDTITFNGVNYPVINAKGVGSTEYGDVGPYIYGMYYIYNQSSNHNYTVLSQYNSSGSVLKDLLLYSSSHVNVKPGEIEVSPSSNYLVAAMYGSKPDGDSDGFVFLSDINITNFTSLVFDGYNSDTNYTLIWDVYYAVNDEIYVGGAVFNSSSGYFEGLMIVYSFNGTDLVYERSAVYINSSNDVFITDIIIGPDGYLYLAVYEPYYYQGEFYDYLGLIVKVDPVTLDVLNSVKARLYNSQGYVQSATITGSLAADDTYLYLTFNKLSDQYGAYGYTSSILVAKLDTSFNTQWVKIIDDPDYDEYSYDIAVTIDNVTVIGMTDNSYGSSNFQGYNGFLVSLDPVTGSPKYGLLIGGSGYDQFKDPTISWNQRLYIIGVSDTTNFYEEYIPGSNILISSMNTLYEPIHGALKPLSGKETFSGIDVETLKQLISVKERNIAGNPVTTGSRELFVKVRTGGAIYRLGSDNYLGVRMFKPVAGGVGARSTLMPGILVKLGVDTGQQVQPPKPIPENKLLIIVSVVAAGLITYYVIRRR